VIGKFLFSSAHLVDRGMTLVLEAITMAPAVAQQMIVTDREAAAAFGRGGVAAEAAFSW